MIWDFTKFVFSIVGVFIFTIFALLMTIMQASFETLTAFFKCYMWREFFDFVADTVKIIKTDFKQLRDKK